MSVSLTVFQGRAGDRNDLAITGARSLATELGRRFGSEAVAIGRAQSASNGRWDAELLAAMPALRALNEWFDRLYSLGHRSVAATSRCAASLATLPALAKHHPDACVVWFDAHGDLNTPDSTTSGYLGGLALSGPVGLWESGLGAGLAISNVVLVGQRDMDPFEIDVIRAHGIPHIVPSRDMTALLSAAIDLRPVYVHLDCDVLNPGIVPTEYVHDGGLSLDDLRAACRAIAASEVVGIEIAEFQNAWQADGPPVSPMPLLDALRPILDRVRD